MPESFRCVVWVEGSRVRCNTGPKPVQSVDTVCVPSARIAVEHDVEKCVKVAYNPRMNNLVEYTGSMQGSLNGKVRDQCQWQCQTNITSTELVLRRRFPIPLRLIVCRRTQNGNEMKQYDTIRYNTIRTVFVEPNKHVFDAA